MPGSRAASFRWLDGLMAVLFAVSAAIQYNDPDPLPWMAVYGGAAVACLLISRPPFGRPLAAVVGSAALIWAVLLLPDALADFGFRDLFRSMEADSPSIELGRELLGLLIVAAWMVVLMLRTGGSGSRPANRLPTEGS